MIGSRLFAYPYQFARTPLAVLQVTVVRRLPEDSLFRRGFNQAFGLLDSTAGHLFGDTSLQRQGAERVHRPPTPKAHDTEPAPPEKATPEKATAEKATAEKATAEKATAEKATAEKVTSAKRARAQAMKAEAHADARPNQSIKTIRRRLEQTEAVAEVRDRRTQEQETR